MFESILETAYIVVPIDSCVNSPPIRQPSPPLPFVPLDLALGLGHLRSEVVPVEDAFSVFFIIHEISNIQIPIVVHLYPFAVFLVVSEGALVHVFVFGEHDCHAVSLFFINLSEIYLPITLNQLQFRAFKQFLNMYMLMRKRLIIGEELA